MKSVFVTGTDTGVGKTLVACALLHAMQDLGVRAAGMKPVAAGMEDGQFVDVEALIAASWVTAPRELVNPYAFPEPIAPHLAAARAGRAIDLGLVEGAFGGLSRLADAVVVEGAGGFLVPLGPGASFADLAVRLRLPVVLVVGVRLGCLNHALLTAEAIRARGLSIAGWVANRIDPAMPAGEENVLTLRAMLGAPCLGELPWLPVPDARVAAGLLDLSVLW